MSPKLPVVSAREAVQVFDHPTLKPGLLRKLIRDAQLDVEEFRRMLRA